MSIFMDNFIKILGELCPVVLATWPPEIPESLGPLAPPLMKHFLLNVSSPAPLA
jgi:hypothetical protein